MISDFFRTAGRMVRLVLIVGALLTVSALLIVGAKLPGWFSDVGDVVRSRQLDTREAELKSAEKAAQDKREAELKAREQALSAKEAAKAAEVEAAARKVAEAEKAKAQEAANRTRKQAEAKPKQWWANDPLVTPEEAKQAGWTPEELRRAGASPAEIRRLFPATDVTMPDGTVIKNVPYGMSMETLKAKLAAYDAREVAARDQWSTLKCDATRASMKKNTDMALHGYGTHWSDKAEAEQADLSRHCRSPQATQKTATVDKEASIEATCISQRHTRSADLQNCINTLRRANS